VTTIAVRPAPDETSPFPLDAFDRRLDASAPTPIAVAYSGGGDSLMALKLTKTWADRHGRSIIAFSVDHRLQPTSETWIAIARATATRLDVGFQALVWDGDKPVTGLPAAAREARHRLIADAARAVGASVVVFGHTADDAIEGELMRAEGHRLGRLREWSPSPVWPQGRGLFLLRPLLGVRRADIRAALVRDNESWIDDPANLDSRSPRARARPQASRAAPVPIPEVDAVLADVARTANMGSDGAITLERERLRRTPPTALRRLLAAAVTCAGGQARSPRGARLEALVNRLRAREPLMATLGGAKIVAADQVLIVRDAGEVRRGGLSLLTLAARETGVWDGRFEVRSGPSPITVQAMAGHRKSLPDREQAALRALDAAVRPALPIVISGVSAATCPILAETAVAQATLLVKARFLAACGVISKEGAT